MSQTIEEHLASLGVIGKVVCDDCGWMRFVYREPAEANSMRQATRELTSHLKERHGV